MSAATEIENNNAQTMANQIFIDDSPEMIDGPSPIGKIV